MCFVLIAGENKCFLIIWEPALCVCYIPFACKKNIEKFAGIKKRTFASPLRDKATIINEKVRGVAQSG